MKLLGRLVELQRRHARADLARQQIHRAHEDLARARPSASISAGDFLMITGSERSSSRSVASVARMWSWTSVWLARAVEAPQQPALLVVVDQRLGLLVVRREPLLDRLGLVVLALRERLAALVADALVLGRVERPRGRRGRSEHWRRPDRRCDARSRRARRSAARRSAGGRSCSSSSSSASACADRCAGSRRAGSRRRPPPRPCRGSSRSRARRARGRRCPCTPWPPGPSSVSLLACSRSRSPVAM